jgi:hypothetical protein
MAAIEETRMSRFLMCPNSWGQDAADLVRRELLQQALGDGDGCVARIAAGREGVRLL